MMAAMSLAPPASSPSSGSLGPSGSSALDASPPARRAARPGWRDPRFAIGLVLVALSVVVGVRVVDGRDDTTPVLAAARPLVAGQRLGPDDVAVVEVRFAAAGDADRYLPAGSGGSLGADGALGALEGTVVTRGVGTGELVPRAATSATQDADVQVPLAVPLGRVPSTVQVGSSVDVWATPEPSTTSTTQSEVVEPTDTGAAGGADRVLRGVPVLAVSRGQGLGPDSEIRVVVGVPDRGADVAAVVRTLAGAGVLLVHRPEGS
jgi:hypothetical protein